jgi:hypothetical protein
MKFKLVLDEKGLNVEDLPKSQQKKISEISKIKRKIDEIEIDGVDESVENEFESIKAHFETIDEELVDFIAKFDVEKSREQRARLAEMRAKVGKEPKIKAPTQEPVMESSVEAPIEAPTAPIVPPSRNEPDAVPIEQIVAKQLEELKKEAVVYPDQFMNIDDEELVNKGRVHNVVGNQEHAEEVEAEEEFEKQGERKPRKVNVPLIVMGVGALLLTWGAVNFFKERR